MANKVEKGAKSLKSVKSQASKGGKVAATKKSPTTEIRKRNYTKVKLQVRAKAILTFDDGLADMSGNLGDSLSLILSTLDKHGIRAHFYLTGTEVVAHPTWAKLIVTRGHFVENHGWNHEKHGALAESTIKNKLERAQSAIVTATGKSPRRFRPPEGDGIHAAELRAACKALGLIPTYWDVDTNDWKNKNGGLVRLKFVPRIHQWKSEYSTKGHPLDILMHVLDNTARDLNDLINEMKSDGWSFTTY